MSGTERPVAGSPQKNRRQGKSAVIEFIDEIDTTSNMSLIACFSGKLYGMRSRKAKKKEEGAANEKDKQS